MQKLTYTNSQDVTIDLTTAPFGITEWEGFSNVSMDVQTQTVPFVDGSVYIDNLLDNRELSVTVAINDENNLKRRYELRRQLIKALNPKLGEGILVYKNNYLTKQIKCIPNTPVFETHNSDTTGTPKASVSFTACQPYWEDIDNNIVNFSLTEQPIIQNDGDVDTQVKIKISGQSTNPKVTNITTGRSIGLAGLVTEAIDINTNIGKKSIVGSQMKWTNIFGGYLNGIAYKGDTVVVVGSDGAVLYSLDGVDWKSQVSQTVENLNGVCSNYNFDIFCAVGSTGAVVYSADGKNWHTGNSNITTDFNSVTSSTSLFVAVGNDGVIATSTDGSTFTAVTTSIPSTVDLTCVIYDGTNFVAVGTGGTIVKSTDGQTWTTVTSGTELNLYGISYQIDIGYLAVGSDGLMLRSYNLTDWSELESPTSIGLKSVAFNPYLNEFFICGLNGVVVTGLDTWTVQDTTETADNNFCCFSKDLGIMLICGKGVLLKAPNQTDWTVLISIEDTVLNDIMYIAGLKLYVAVGSHGNVFTSNNGNLWIARNVGLDVDLYALALNPNNNCIIGIGTGGTIIRSYNGYTWEKVLDGLVPFVWYLKIDDDSYLLIDDNYGRLIIGTNLDNGRLNDITYSSELNKFIAVGYDGRIITSTDGSIWTEADRVTDNTLNSIVISEGLILAVGNNGTVITSRNAVDWSVVDSGLEFDIQSVTTSPTKTRFMCVGKDGYGAYSRNGTQWELVRINANRAYLDLIAVCYSEVYSQFVAVGFSGVIAISIDGQTWTASYSGTGLNYSSIIFSIALGKYLAVGNKGTVMTSYTDNEENLISKISPNSDINFSLVVGQNLLRVSCESGDPRVTIEYKQKYIGV